MTKRICPLCKGRGFLKGKKSQKELDHNYYLKNREHIIKRIVKYQRRKRKCQ